MDTTPAHLSRLGPADSIESLKIAPPDESPAVELPELTPKSGSETLGLTPGRPPIVHISDGPAPRPPDSGAPIAPPEPVGPALAYIWQPTQRQKRPTKPTKVPGYKLELKPAGKKQKPYTEWTVDTEERVVAAVNNMTVHLQPGQKITLAGHGLRTLQSLALQGVPLKPVVAEPAVPTQIAG